VLNHRRTVRSRTFRRCLAALTAAACLVAVALTATASYAGTLLTTTQGEAMTLGGCASAAQTHAVFYCNEDSASSSYAFDQAGRFSITVNGASSGDSAAGINVLVGGERVAALTFTGTAYTQRSATFDLASAGAKEIRLVLETDSGQNDTLVDWFELYYEGPTPPPPPAPNPPPTGAYASGVYRNLFTEWDASLTDAAVSAKLDAYWSHFFTGTDDTKRLYYPTGSNTNGALAYIKDTGNDDVRSEGMSYGMMIAVQLNKKAEFDAMWNWAKTYMQHKTGARTGYFCWQADFSGSCRDNNPASDGEEYFATALFFAGHRWGNGSGIYHYVNEANAILNTMLHKEDINGGVVESITNMFNRDQKMIVFVPYATAATYSDPSYHLPAFYELWARWATGWNGNQAADRQFWRDAAARSRLFFTQATNGTTGLNPDYAEFNGAPNNTGNHGDFRFDAWRTSVNWAVDYAWWAADPSSKTLTDRMQAFFESEGVNAYVNQYSLAGNPLSSERSPGLIASNGAASLSATNARAWKFVEALWNLQPPTGKYRYFDGLLNFMALLHASGNFRIHQPGGGNPGGTPDDQAPTAPTGVTVGVKTATSVSLSWTASSDNVAVSGYTAYLGSGTSGAAGCTHVSTTACTITGLSPDTTYSVTVKAQDDAGNTSTGSAPVSVTTTAGSAAGNRDAYLRLEAESYDASSGVTTQTGDDGTVVEFTGSGSHIALNGVQFGTGGAGGVQLRLLTSAPGVNIHVRLGSATASPACTVYPDSNGAWHVKSNTCYPKPAGTANVYLTTTGRVTINSLTFVP
jgi:endo-1,4-beta-D-glucanase Y/chitodextrinase